MLCIWDSRTQFRCTSVSFYDIFLMKLFYRKFGYGPPLFILHGLYGSSDNWVTIAKNLAENYTVYLPDQRNHGQSPHSTVHDYKSMSDDLYELVTDLKINKFFLAGHSMGGKTAVSFAMKWPEMINGLLIADISPFENKNSNLLVYNQHFNILNAILSVNLAEVFSRKDAEILISHKILSEKERGFVLKNLERSGSNSFTWKLNARSLLDNLDRIMEGLDHNRTVNEQITGFPVFFLRGGDSDYLPDADFKYILNIFPAAEFITIPGAGHWIHADKPDEVIKWIKKLLVS
jgi:esterase